MQQGRNLDSVELQLWLVHSASQVQVRLRSCVFDCGLKTPRLQLATHFGGFPSRHRRSEHLGEMWLGMVPTTCYCLASGLAVVAVDVGKQAEKHWHSWLEMHLWRMNHHPAEHALDSFATNVPQIGIDCISKLGHSYLWGVFSWHGIQAFHLFRLFHQQRNLVGEKLHTHWNGNPYHL